MNIVVDSGLNLRANILSQKCMVLYANKIIIQSAIAVTDRLFTLTSKLWKNVQRPFMHCWFLKVTDVDFQARTPSTNVSDVSKDYYALEKLSC